MTAAERISAHQFALSRFVGGIAGEQWGQQLDDVRVSVAGVMVLDERQTDLAALAAQGFARSHRPIGVEIIGQEITSIQGQRLHQPVNASNIIRGCCTQAIELGNVDPHGLVEDQHTIFKGQCCLGGASA
jgi:hypothetical protein